MLVVVIGVVSQKLNKLEKVRAFACAFRKIPRGLFPLIFFFFKDSLLPLSYSPRDVDVDGDRFPQNI